NRIVNRGNDRPLVTVNAGKERFAARDGREQITTHLIFDRGDAIAGGAQFAEGMDVHGVGFSSGSRLNSFMARFRSPRAKSTSASTARSIPRLTSGSSSAVKSSST